ncbi:type II secretion system protein GspC [Trichlorobacter ammonificans]|uniref:Type II secretory pathway component PulC-like protein n=1 Tax=Trichlorobacter ammonificans TaxID=2916410 RepID=A0ABM9D9W7_9BACT|nr:type II secretion system protein GspC [Trichlorobacter ammonificans]CAH2031542.1 Type II secretory pathway component PulC-like protein [Trichlorobacter ammonificans]
MQRSILPANIVLGILILLVTARILADIAAYRLGSLTPAAPAAPADGAASRQALPLGAFGSILEKGLFGPATKGTLTPLTMAAPQPAAAAAPAVAPGDLVLLGTAAGTPRQSFVLVRKSSTNEERVFRVGERVFDLGVLSAVHKETADLKSGDRTITLRTPNAPQEAPRPAASPAQAATAPVGVIPASGGSSGIIEQRALNAALDNIGQAMTDARLLPSVKDGKVEGFRLSEVKPQGVFAAIGLRNGDVLQKINDFPVDSPEKAIQSFMTLKGQTRIKLDLIRDGAPTSLSYEIR